VRAAVRLVHGLPDPSAVLPPRPLSADSPFTVIWPSPRSRVQPVQPPRRRAQTTTSLRVSARRRLAQTTGPPKGPDAIYQFATKRNRVQRRIDGFRLGRHVQRALTASSFRWSNMFFRTQRPRAASDAPFRCFPCLNTHLTLCLYDAGPHSVSVAQAPTLGRRHRQRPAAAKARALERRAAPSEGAGSVTAVCRAGRSARPPLTCVVTRSSERHIRLSAVRRSTHTVDVAAEPQAREHGARPVAP
jgi:hypothetical protein